MRKGIVSKYYPVEGYGLITDEEGHELFFYAKDVASQCKSEIKEGEEIEFDPALWNHFHAVHLCEEHKELERKLREGRK